MKKSILIVEDDVFMGDLLRQTLASEQRSLRIIRRGETAMTRLNEPDLPDLLILDIKLKDFNGLDILTAMRAEQRTAGMKIMMLSSVQDRSRIDEALALGADDYVAKPFRTEHLLATVARLLGDPNVDAERLPDDFSGSAA